MSSTGPNGLTQTSKEITMWISSDTPEPELEFDSETKKMMAEVMEQFLLEGEASGKFKVLRGKEAEEALRHAPRRGCIGY